MQHYFPVSNETRLLNYTSEPRGGLLKFSKFELEMGGM